MVYIELAPCFLLAMNLFAYGTLIFPEVTEIVLGRVPPSEPALLRNFERKKIRGECFPAIYQREGARVNGLLFRELSEKDFKILDYFEAELYERREVSLKLNGARTEKVYTYIISKDSGSYLVPEDWSESHFRENSLTSYLKDCRSWMNDFE